MRIHYTSAFLAAFAVAVVNTSPTHSNRLDIARHRHRRDNLTSLPALLKATSDAAMASSSSNCFPSAGFQMPSSLPSNVNNWWCDPKTEYAFLGFSYEVTMCTLSPIMLRSLS
jgi:hypothetical protein